MKRDFRAAVLKHLAYYISEAEHQDGDAYWDQFQTAEEALDDFGTFLYELQGTDGGPRAET